MPAVVDRVSGPVTGSFALRDAYSQHLWDEISFTAAELAFRGTWVIVSDAVITTRNCGTGSASFVRTERITGSRRYPARRVDGLTYDTCPQCAAAA